MERRCWHVMHPQRERGVASAPYSTQRVCKGDEVRAPRAHNRRRLVLALRFRV
jgi:hypothetical protein